MKAVAQQQSPKVADDQIAKGYKRTEVGVIPENWVVKRLEELTVKGPKNGFSGPSSNNATGTPTLRLSATTSGYLQLTPETVKWLNEVIPAGSDLFLKLGDVIFQRSNTLEFVGTAAYFDGPSDTYVYPDILIRIRCHDEWMAKWVWMYSNAAHGRKFFKSIAAGSTGSMPKITGGKLRSFPLPIPPEKEKRAIVAALSDADALVASLDRLIEKKRAIKQGTMQQLLTAKKRLPGFEEEWETKQLGSTLIFIRSANNPRSDLAADGAAQYVHYGDIHALDSSTLDCTRHDLPWIDGDKVAKIPRLKNGDLVLADASEDLEGTGKSAEITNVGERDIVAGLHTLVARDKNSSWAPGFKGYLQYIPDFKRQLERVATGISVYAISKRQIAEMSMRLPGLDEQAAIVRVLLDMDKEIAALERRRAKMGAVKEGMMQVLLTGKVRLVEPEGSA